VFKPSRHCMAELVCACLTQRVKRFQPRMMEGDASLAAEDVPSIDDWCMKTASRQEYFSRYYGRLDNEVPLRAPGWWHRMKYGMSRSKDEAKSTTRAGFRAMCELLRRWEQENGLSERNFENITEAMQFRPSVSGEVFDKLTTRKTASVDNVLQFSSDNVSQTLAIVIGGKALSEDAPRMLGIGDSLTKQLLRLGDSFTVWSFGRTDDFLKKEQQYRHFAGGVSPDKYWSVLSELFAEMHQWLAQRKCGKALIFDVIAPTNFPGDGAKAMEDTDALIDVLRRSFADAASKSSSGEDARRRVFLIGTNTYMASVPRSGYVDHCRKSAKYHDYVCCKLYQALTRCEVMLPARAAKAQVTSIWADTVGEGAERVALGDTLRNFKRLLKTYVSALAAGTSSEISNLPGAEFKDVKPYPRSKMFEDNLYVVRKGPGEGELLAYGSAKLEGETRRMKFHGPESFEPIKLPKDYSQIPSELCFLDRMALLLFEDSSGDRCWLACARRAGTHAAETKFSFGLSETIVQRRFPMFEIDSVETEMSISELVRERAEKSGFHYPSLQAAILAVEEKDALVQKFCNEMHEEEEAGDYAVMRQMTGAEGSKDSSLGRLDDAMADLEFSTSNFFWTLLYASVRPEWMMSTSLGAQFHLLSAMQLVADSREELGELPRASVISSFRP